MTTVRLMAATVALFALAAARPSSEPQQPQQPPSSSSAPAPASAAASASAPIAASVTMQVDSAKPETMDVTLLGTGTPLPLPDRFGPATLVEIGREKLLFDCGRGCATRLFQKGTILRNAKLFVTHLHFDHIVGIPDLWLTGWLPTMHPGDFSAKPMKIVGPEGTTAMVEHLRQAYAADIAFRATTPYLAPPAFEAVDLAPGVVYENDGVKVTAFEVDHGLGPKASYGYRVDWNGHSVVISGDTKFSQNVIKAATGADLVVHEIAMVKNPEIAKLPVAKTILAVHTTPEEAGRVFAAAKPRLAVYTHFVVAGQLNNAPTPADYVAATRATYDGPLEAGEDLMTIHIGQMITIDRSATPHAPAISTASASALPASNAAPSAGVRP